MNMKEKNPAQAIFEEAPNYSFFQLVNLLHNINGDDQERDQDFKAKEQRIRFSASASVAFPKADVQSLSLLKSPIGSDLDAISTTENGSERYFLETTFLGLHGSQSPLPYHYIDTTSYEYAQNYPGIRLFLDFFNQRLLTLMYRTWRKYRYYLRFQPDATDGFSQQMFSLVGLADQSLRGETPINWCKMLSYTGTLASRSRSPNVVSGIIAHYFELANVSISQWVFRYVDIPDFQLSKLGKKNCAMGNDFFLGGKAADRSGKFVIKIHSLSQERFKEFLPNGKNYQPLVKLVEFVLREPLAYDLELGMVPSDLSPMKSGDEKSCRLGWTTFIGNEEKLKSKQRSVLIHVRS